MDTQVNDLHKISQEFDILDSDVRAILLSHGEKIQVKLFAMIAEPKSWIDGYIIPKVFYDEIKESATVLDNWVIDINKAINLSTDAVPLKSGAMVYFLFDMGVLVYIGQSIQICARVGQHLSEGIKRFDKIAAFSVSKNELSLIEGINIYKYKPIYNKSVWTREDYFRQVLSLCSFM